MATLASLKLAASIKPVRMPTIVGQRNKLAKRLWEQAELAKAQQAGSTFFAPKLRTFVEQDTGLRKQIQVNKRIRPWWFTADNGKLALSVRYGAKVLELAKGKFSIELASEKDLVTTLELIKAAVLQGELDTAITAASTKLRAGFERRSA